MDVSIRNIWDAYMVNLKMHLQTKLWKAYGVRPTWNMFWCEKYTSKNSFPDSEKKFQNSLGALFQYLGWDKQFQKKNSSLDMCEIFSHTYICTCWIIWIMYYSLSFTDGAVCLCLSQLMHFWPSFKTILRG